MAMPIMGQSRVSATATASQYVPQELLRYQLKLYEGIAAVYNEAYFYQTAKGWMLKVKHLRLLDMGDKKFIKTGLEVPKQSAPALCSVEQPGQFVNGHLGHLKYFLKEANFYKKAGFYNKALTMIEELQDYVTKLEERIEESKANAHLSRPYAQIQFKFRLWRDKARVLALLNRNEESLETFEEAEELIEAESIKYAKLYYIKGLATKRISVEKATETFEWAEQFFYQLLDTDESYYSAQIILEHINLMKRDGKMMEA